MRTILIPTDFSETAMNAIRYAVELFKYEHSKFIVMHAYADEVYENTKEMDRVYFDEYKQKVEEATARFLQKTLIEIKEFSFNPKHSFEDEAKFGSLVDEVNDLVEKYNADVVVMGTKGKSNNKDITFGSQTLQVIKYVKCPVLAIPFNFKGSPPKNILFPTDYMVPYKRRELKLISTLATRFISKLHFLHISDRETLSHRQNDYRTFASLCFEYVNTSFLTLPGKNIVEIINGTVDKMNIDMLIMVNQRHSLLENILYRSSIEKIGLEINIPFLVLQNLPR